MLEKKWHHSLKHLEIECVMWQILSQEADHLRMILQKERDMEIPDKPRVDLPLRQNLPILGTLTNEVRMLDRKSLESEGKMREAATKLRLEREA